MATIGKPTATQRPNPMAKAARLMAIFVGVAVIALTILGPWMTYKPEPFTGEGSPLRQICYFSIFPIALAARRPLLRPYLLFPVPLPMLVALGWCWASLAWSLEPDIALRRLLLTTILIWTIFLVAAELGYARLMHIIRVTLVVALVLNYLAVILIPAFGIHQVDELSDPGLVGDWRGIMLQKNFAGATSAFTILTFALDAKRIKSWLRFLVLVAAAYFLYRSGSKTSIGLTLLGGALGFVYLRYNPLYRWVLVPVLMVAGTATTLYLETNWSKLTAPLYDQGAFTGRTQIWPPLLAYSSDNWVLGAGFGSFWNIGLGRSPIYSYAKGWVTHITQGHDGYLDLLVTIGLPGLLLVVFATIVMPIARLLASKTIARGPGALLLAMVVFCAGHNFTETSIFDRDAIVQTFLMLTVALIYTGTANDASTDRPLRRSRRLLTGPVHPDQAKVPA